MFQSWLLQVWPVGLRAGWNSGVHLPSLLWREPPQISFQTAVSSLGRRGTSRAHSPPQAETRPPTAFQVSLESNPRSTAVDLQSPVLWGHIFLGNIPRARCAGRVPKHFSPPHSIPLSLLLVGWDGGRAWILMDCDSAPLPFPVWS